MVAVGGQLLFLNYSPFQFEFIMLNIDITKLTDALIEAECRRDDSDKVNVMRDALTESMAEEPLFALAVLLAARDYNN